MIDVFQEFWEHFLFNNDALSTTKSSDTCEGIKFPVSGKMSLAMRLCYQLITIFAFCLTVTVIALSYGQFERFLNGASSYRPILSASQNEKKSKVDATPSTERLTTRLNDLEFYSSYHVKGFLRLLASDLNEPIEVWYSKEHQQSRIDYYGGDVKTYQNGQLSLFVKIIPKYDSIKKVHTIGCWKKHKNVGRKVKAQSILPTKWSWPFKGSLNDFKYLGEETIDGKLCMKWRYVHNVLGRNNTYTYWVEKRQPPAPVRYEMVGYDTLLTSYYDKYVIDYSSYEEWKYNKTVFEIPQILEESGCWNASGKSGEEEEHFMNPIAEFVSTHDEDDPVEKQYHRYKEVHGKSYNDTEHLKRKHVFRHNLRFINSINRQNLTFKLKPNAFADMTDEEYDLHKGSLSDHSARRKRKKRNIVYIHEKYKPHKRAPEIPDQLDWRKYGAVSTPRGQGTCGCCWAFAAIGAIEGANFIKTGKMTRLSEQQMVDCTWKVKGVRKNIGNRGCHGGMAWKVMFWARSNIIATSESYGPYKGQEGHCKTNNITEGVKIQGFRRVKKYSAESLRRAVAYYGPTAVAINSHPLGLKFYSHGVFDYKRCSNATDHAVLVVGYGKENGVNYWLVKNSWSTLWGDGGYIKMKEDICGILKKPVVVLNRRIKSYPWNKNKKKNHAYNWHKKSKRKNRKRKRKHRHHRDKI